MTDRFFLPEKPLQRFLELESALRTRFSWWHGLSSVRVAGLTLTTVDGKPRHLVNELWSLSERLKRRSGLVGPFQSSVRHIVAAILIRNGDDADGFFQEFQRVRLLLREARLPRGQTYQGIATLMLRDQAATQGWKVVRRSQVERTRAVYAEMKLHHPWITGGDDLPLAALLSGSEDSPKRMGARFEHLYQGLCGYRFSRGNPLQAVSHLLYLHPEEDDLVMRRFRDLYHAFKDRGLWMFEGDYDEIAVLTFLSQSPAEVATRVLEHRRQTAMLRPRPGRNESFSLACHTAFLELAQVGSSNQPLLDAAAVARIVTIIQAQQGAAVAAAAGAGAAAAAASS